jgi:6-phospho-3-hexuloisomerase
MHTILLDELYRQGMGILGGVTDDQLEDAARRLCGAEKIYVLGIGHSGMFGRILCMKLNHAGLRAYTVFDEINPPIEAGDVFIAISQSGETATILSLADKAIKIGASVLGVTSDGASRLAKKAEHIILLGKIDATVPVDALSFLGTGNDQNVLGCIFGFNIYVLFYALIAAIAGIRGETPESIDARHANLQ